MKRWQRSPAPWTGAFLLLLLATLLFWKVRIIDPAYESALRLGAADLYMMHHPMASYGFEMLREGKIPLWNPYQLCGLPFLAVPFTGLFYPGNLGYLVFDTALATEIDLILHMFFGGVGMWLLATSLGLSAAGAIAGALTFMWSGWMMLNVHQPVLVAGMSWLPFTLLLIERTIRGARWAALGLTLSIACQLFNGATEVFVLNMYVGALFTLFSTISLASRRQWRVSAGRAMLVLGCVVGGALLATPQWMPSLELVERSVRVAGSLSVREASGWRVWGLRDFLWDALRDKGTVSVGFLPIFGLGLGLGFTRFRNLWLFSLIAAVVAIVLAFGGSVFELYFQTPLGGVFRRPMKFVQIYAFAQALMAAIALTCLGQFRSLGIERRVLWRSWSWLTCLLLIAAGLSWLGHHNTGNYYLATALGLVLLFGVNTNPTVRKSMILGLLLLQAATLFFGFRGTHLRPIARPEVFDSNKVLLETLKEAAGSERVYLSSSMSRNPGRTMKQGTYQQLRVLGDYEPLTMRRYATFFEHAGMRVPGPELFSGLIGLPLTSGWSLMDLTSTRLYVVRPGGEFDQALRVRSAKPEEPEFKLIRELRGYRPASSGVRVYERTRYLPRAYYVPSARVLASPSQVLTELARPGFDPRREVLLETESGLSVAETDASTGVGLAEIRSDAPERVAIDVEAERPGFLVLTDAYYPGWKAYIDDREVPIHRANYLFRAVQVGAGTTQVTFEYHPRSFRNGLLVSGMTALSILATWMFACRGKRPLTPPPGLPDGGCSEY